MKKRVNKVTEEDIDVISSISHNRAVVVLICIAVMAIAMFVHFKTPSGVNITETPVTTTASTSTSITADIKPVMSVTTTTVTTACTTTIAEIVTTTEETTTVVETEAPIEVEPVIDEPKIIPVEESYDEPYEAPVEEPVEESIVVTEEDPYEEPTSESMDMTYLGNLKITGYVATGNPTASGVYPYVGGVAMSRSWGFPWGTKIYIEGLGIYTLNDTGCGSSIVDVFCSTEQECYDLTSWRDVYVIN